MTWLDEIASSYDGVPDPGFGPPTVDVAAEGWVEAIAGARDGLGCAFFDFLTAVDELDQGFSVVVHVARHRVGTTESVLLRTRVARDNPTLDTVRHLYAGASWHERETHEMFGIDFIGHDAPATLLLPDGFVGNPLRKDFVLASRVAKPWPGAKEPGESEAGAAPSRRRTRPPGVPDPDEWGPRAGESGAAEA